MPVEKVVSKGALKFYPDVEDVKNVKIDDQDISPGLRDSRD